MSNPDLTGALINIAIFAFPLLFGIICHEVAHGYTAYLQGDPTAKDAGRLNFNPIKHLDPMGTAVFVLTAFLGGFIIGWAKPVPIDPRRFRSLRKGLFLVSLAGPATNFVLALAFAGVFTLLFQFYEPHPQGSGFSILMPLLLIAKAGIMVNIILGVFNLLPVPPLDGSKILMSLLPRKLAIPFARVERYGMLILILLLATGILGYVIFPTLQLMLKLVTTIFGLPPSLLM